MVTATELVHVFNYTERHGFAMLSENDTTVPNQEGVSPGGEIYLKECINGENCTNVSMVHRSCNSSAADEDQFRFYLSGICTLTIIILGVLGNSMAMIVLTRRTMRTSTNIFLTALAIWDTIVLLVCVPLLCLPELYAPFRVHAYAYIVVYIYPMGLVAQTATVWITVTFTVERYIAVCHPLKAAGMCTVPRARMCVLAISLVSILYNAPRWFEYTIHSLKDNYNQTCSLPDKAPLGKDPFYHKIYFGWLYFLVMCFLPLSSLTILNIFLIRAVRKSRQQRRDMNVKQSRENNVTIMLTSVVMVFLICQVPALIYNMAYSIDVERVEASREWKVTSHFRNFLVTLNSAVNFILYCALGEKFRRTFVRTFCPCLVRKMPGRFQSFSCHQNNMDSLRAKAGCDNGSTYEFREVTYYKHNPTQRKRETDSECLDLKIVKSINAQNECVDTNNGAAETSELFGSETNQEYHNNIKLTNNKNRSRRPC